MDPSLAENYRPISNLPYLSKLLERAANTQILHHLQGNGLLPDNQSAYRHCHSTETALLKVTSDALMAADQGKLTLLGLLDLNSAFDCVDHPIFIQRLKVSFGISGQILRWIESYLGQRYQCVRYNGTISDATLVVCGVPQGSVLGPLFFIQYAADVFEIAEKHGFRIHGYADDLQLYDHCTPDSTDVLETRFIRCVEDIQNWMMRNKLKLNASKTEIIWLGSPRRLAGRSFGALSLSGHTVAPADSVRNLGVIFDPALSFDTHVCKLAQTCYYHLRQLRKIRRSLSSDSCHALVRATIISRLDYCNGLLGGAPAFLNKQLNGVLRAAARLVLVRPRTSEIADAMRADLHWLQFPARTTFKLCVMAFRCLDSTAPGYLVGLCNPVSSLQRQHDLRSNSSGLLVVPRCRTSTIGPRAFAVSCPSAWNIIPAELRCPGLELAQFRRRLKTFLFASAG